MVFLLAAATVLAVIPGIFDSTYNTRLAIFPLVGVAAMLAGNGRFTMRFALAAAVPAALQFTGLLPHGPVSGAIPQIVIWCSFWMMLCGASGMLSRWGRRRVFDGLIAAAALMALLSLLLPDDLPTGNPNRQGMLLALSLTALSTGISRPGRILAVSAGALVAAGLLRSGFYTAMVATAGALLWFLLAGRRRRAHPGLPLAAMIAAQAAIIVAPSIAARIHPSLELRSLMWRSGFDLLEESGPMGTGTARSRLALFSEGGERLQVLAGPDSRIDFLHSEILALPVEQGVLGAISILALLSLFAARRFTPARGAVLLCCWPLLAMDLPLATPLGALPAAFGLAWALGPGRGRMLTVPRGVMIPAMVAALFWASLVVEGNRSLENGLRLGTTGRSAESAEELERASVLVPWEERSLFYRAVALARDGRPEEALVAIDGFLSVYPGYWRAWAMRGDLQRACGAGAPAAESYLRAVLEAPAGTDSLGLTAFNAAAEAPGDSAEASALARALLTAGSQIPRGDPAILVEFARRSARTAAMVPGRDGDVFAALLKTSLWNLLEATAIPGVDTEDAAGVLESFRPLAGLVAARDPERSAVIDGLMDSIEAAVILDTSR